MLEGRVCEDYFRSPCRAEKRVGSRGLLRDDGVLGVGEILVAAVVAAIVDEFLGGGKFVEGDFHGYCFWRKKKLVVSGVAPAAAATSVTPVAGRNMNSYLGAMNLA